jgi:tetratricopeptide (TPR) repeat protein
MAKARELAFRSIREYNLGKFDEALKDASDAYELSGQPALLFNIGQCHRALGNWSKAEFFYRGYLRGNPRARNRDEVTALVEAMREKAAARQTEAGAAAPVVVEAPSATPYRTAVIVTAPPTPAPVTEAPRVVDAETAASGSVPTAAIAEEKPERHYLRPATWWLGGSGAAAVIGASILGVLAQANDASSPGPNGVVEHSVSAGAYTTGQYEGLTADILWAVGGGLIVTAVIVAFAGR